MKPTNLIFVILVLKITVTNLYSFDNKCQYFQDKDGRGKWYSVNNMNITLDELSTNYRECLNLEPIDSIAITKVKALLNGGTRYTLQQYKYGLKVQNGYCYVFTKDGLIYSISNNFYKGNINKGYQTINKETIFQVIELYKKNIDTTQDKIIDIEYIIFPFEEISTKKIRLYKALKFKVKHGINITDDKEVYLDIETGKEISNISLVAYCNPTNGSTATTIYDNTKIIYTDKELISQKYYLYNDCDQDYYTPKIETKKYISYFNSDNYYSTDGTWTSDEQKKGAQSHWGTERAASYYGSKWNRNDAINFGGIPYVSRGTIKVINYDTPITNPINNNTYETCNSFWLNGTIYLGECTQNLIDDNRNSIDIIGHEYTHAIIEFEAGLQYKNESGALNESFADIFGEAVERFALGNNNWIHADQINTDNLHKRSFINPKLYGVHDCNGSKGQANTYGVGYWYNGTTCDQGGVHLNSGVQNHWFYLIVNGGTGTNDNGFNYNIPNGIGFDKAIEIAYIMLTEKLGPTSTYGDSKQASLDVAEEKYGINSYEYNIIEMAWCAVGMGTNCGNQKPDLTVQSTQVTPTVIQDGGNANVSCQIKNQGLANANSSYTAVWLSRNQTFEGAPTDINLNADMFVPSLNSGQSSSILTKLITIPPGTAGGTWYIMFGADALESVSEGSIGESNNQVFIPITITNTATGCTNANFYITPSSNWQNHSNSHLANDYKIYRVPFTSGNVYTFKTGCGNGAIANYDTYLELFKSNCASVKANDDSCESTRSAISLTANFTGDAYLKVSGYNGTGGNYTLAYQYHTCTGWYTSPSSKSFTSSGGSGAFTAYTSIGGCAFYATNNNPSWIRNITFPGNGVVNYTVDANTGPARTGTISIKDVNNVVQATYTIYQDEGTICRTCPSYDFAITPATSWQTHSSDHITDGCKLYRIYVTAGSIYTFKTGCGDGATSNYDTYLDLLNSGCSSIISNDDGCESRRSNITWKATYTGYVYLKVSGFGSAGGSYTLSYKYNICTNWLTLPTSENYSVTGGSGSFEVKTQYGGCGFYAMSNNNWINGISYPGGGFVNYDVDFNTEAARTGTISIFDDENIIQKTFTVYQDAGSVCTTCPSYDYSINPSTNWQTHSSNHASNGCKLYRIPVTSGRIYTFKTGCDDGATADYDTYMVLYNNSCSNIIENDDGCSPNRSIITWASTYNGYAYLKIMGFNNLFGNYTLSYKYSSCTIPSQPGTISGNNLVCQSSSQTYTINPVAGASSYTWNLPTGWAGSSSSNSISATTGNSGGTISVYASNDCGSSLSRTLNVNLISIPTKPGNINGNTNICQNSSQVYSVNTVLGASEYSWYLPSGWLGNSTSNSINSTAGSSSGTIYVTANNNCGNSLAQTLDVIVNPIPTSINSITGSTNLCQELITDYSIGTITNATDYTWTWPTGWNLNTGQGTSSINIKSGANSGQICVSPYNLCGYGNQICKYVTINQIPGTANISGPTTPTLNTNVNYSISNAINASYTWTVPSNWIINSGQGTSAINVKIGTSTGQVCATPFNSCGTGTQGCLNVNILTGIDLNNSKSNNISIFPNPTNGELTLQFPAIDSEKYTIILSNASGQKLHEKTIDINKNTPNYQLDIKEFSNGIYILTIQSNKIFKVFKVQKN